LKIIFDLEHRVDDTYTGTWHTTLTATYFTAVDQLEPAGVVLPVSARGSPANRPSYFTVPESRATIPQNARKAIFRFQLVDRQPKSSGVVMYCHQTRKVFGDNNALYGHSPFRELHLLIIGQLAGVAWPFSVIFTGGGVVPAFWWPVVGIDAFDLFEDEIDIAPFLPILINDRGHTFEIRVVGIDDDGKGHG
jgi:hypothetical protein